MMFEAAGEQHVVVGEKEQILAGRGPDEFVHRHGAAVPFGVFEDQVFPLGERLGSNAGLALPQQ